jgi:acyl transferase domain-containing protein
MLESLAALYERGVAVDWSGFDREYNRRKVALPTYPFRRERFWLQPREVATRESDSDLLYRLEWQPARLADQTAVAHASDWLIVERGRGMGDGLAERLRQLGQRVLVVHGFRPPPTGQYVDVVYLCEGCETTDAPAEAEAASVGLLRLVQAMSRTGTAARLWLVTRGAQAVTGAEPVEVAHAALWGLARTIRLEHPEFQCVSVDLAPDAEDLDRLAAEMLSPGESQIACRNGTRYVARLVRADETDAPPPIQADGCYLITGGLGALGLAMARCMADQGARQLVLAGRSSRTDESALAGLSAGGVTVQVVRADVSRPEDVTRLLAACQQLGPLHGIVHAAGVLDDGILEKQTAERFAEVIAPKARGAWQLHLQTQALRLDFFVCFSSVASLMGSPGQGNYAAANAFLDALAHHRRARGLAALSINWGPWANAGMAANLQSRLQAHGEGMIDSAVGVRLFARALAQGAAQIGAMRVDWARYAATYPAPEFLAALLDQPAAPPPGARPRPAILQRLRATPVGQRQELLEDFVQSQVAAVLGHLNGAVPRTRGFADLGMDSLAAIELRTRLEQSLDCRLPTTLAFDYPSVAALSAHLIGHALHADCGEVGEVGPDGDGDLVSLTREEIAALLASELSTPEEGKTHEHDRAP